VYDLNHGFDSNHKQVSVLKESVTDSGVTVSGNLINNTTTCTDLYLQPPHLLLPASSTSLAGVCFDGNSFGLLSIVF
jgi:hypothetical protein